MPTRVPRRLLEVRYYQAAQEYLRSLPLEHFMEATPQARQREIFLESLALIKATLPKVHVFNELLVQYPLRGRKRPGQVVPDNMIVVYDGPIEAEGSYDLPLQPARPFWVLEYVSKGSKRKDYDDNMEKYERHLKVPYYLVFYPEVQELTLYRHNGRKYVTVKPNGQGRYAIPELEMEVALLDGWVRFWFRGELLPLPADLLRQVNETRQQRDEAQQQRDEAQQQLNQTQQQRDEAQQQRDEARRRAEEERRARVAAEAEAARLRAELEALRRKPAK
jgi:Uma2 family endonuclease